jgi:vancomycin permeability regulator SanA
MLVLVVLIGTVFVFSQLLVLHSADGRIFDVEEAPSERVVIVLGASVLRSGQPSDMLADRLLTALDLYHAGKAEKFLLSGDHGKVDYDEVESMRKFLLEREVSEGDIVLDHAGFDTFDSMSRAKKVFGLNEALVVSQSYHLPRAIYVAENNDLEVFGVSADRQNYVKIEYFKLREMLARVKAVLDVWLGSEPKFLGEEISI